MSNTLDTSLLSNGAPLLLSPHPADFTSPRHGQPPPSSSSSAPVPSAPAHASYGPFTAYCFTVNYILGVGVLGMPYAFVKAGWLLSTFCLLLVTLMATLTALWLSEVGVRALRLERRAIKDMTAQPLSPTPANALIIADLPVVTGRRIEMNELVDIFLGLKARRLYEVLLCIYMIGALWSYSAVFAQSMAGQLAISAIANNYLFYLALFSVVVVPLTCLEMTELKPLAISLAIFRFVSLGTMMLTALISLYSFPAPSDDGAPPVSTATSAPYVSDIGVFQLAGLATVFPVSIYSQIFHHSVPGLAHPLQDKRRLPQVFTSVLLTTFALYAGLGITVGLYYGSGVKDVCTLNWVEYSGERGLGRDGRGGVASFISYLIVLFPPIDIISAFPLNAITLANNIMSAVVQPHLHTQRRYTVPFRLLAALLPLIGACFVRSLDSILHYTGCVGVLIAFLYPVLLQWQSQKIDRMGAHPDEDEVEEEVVLKGKVKDFVNGGLAMGGVLTFSVVGLVAVIVLSFLD